MINAHSKIDYQQFNTLEFEDENCYTYFSVPVDNENRLYTQGKIIFVLPQWERQIMFNYPSGRKIKRPTNMPPFKKCYIAEYSAHICRLYLRQDKREITTGTGSAIYLPGVLVGGMWYYDADKINIICMEES